LDLAEFRNLKQSEIARGNVKHSAIVVNGIAYQPEQYESYLFHSWLVERGIYAIHVPNERKCSVQEMVMLKSLGLTAGASDHHIFDSPPAFPWVKGVLVEMKVGKGKATESQKEYISEMRRRGWLGICVTGAESAISYMKSLGY
jgi:hypothetical protein